MDKLKKKDASSTIIFGFDWSDWLSSYNETIVGYSLSTPDNGLTLSNEVSTTELITFFASGGTLGKVYPVVCQIKTSGGQTPKRTMFIRIENL